MHELAELKQIVLNLKSKVEELEIILPRWFSLGDVAKDINRKRDTIYKYTLANFEPDVDFKKSSGKIYISRDALFRVRKHYAK